MSRQKSAWAWLDGHDDMTAARVYSHQLRVRRAFPAVKKKTYPLLKWLPVWWLLLTHFTVLQLSQRQGAVFSGPAVGLGFPEQCPTWHIQGPLLGDDNSVFSVGPGGSLLTFVDILFPLSQTTYPTLLCDRVKHFVLHKVA